MLLLLEFHSLFVRSDRDDFISALVGVMFMLVVGAFAWNSIRTLFKVPRADALVITGNSGDGD